tara:strand:+ start:539 stop:706 length:168 start_codon:yes stop_codon:yes gene_type:complete
MVFVFREDTNCDRMHRAYEKSEMQHQFMFLKHHHKQEAGRFHRENTGQFTGNRLE